MTQEDKSLLLKDLCARLPYNVKCYVPTYNCAMTLTGKRLNYFCFHKDEWGIDYSHEIETVLDPLNDQNNDYVVKPYLRSMSSMTEEESNELESITFPLMEKDWDGNENPACIRWIDIPKYMDFMLSHHFDYLGLIEKGLAIEVTENNNPYKE